MRASPDHDDRRQNWRRDRGRLALRWLPVWGTGAVLAGWSVSAWIEIPVFGDALGIIFGLLVAAAVVNVIFTPQSPNVGWQHGAANGPAAPRLLRRLERQGWVVLHGIPSIDHVAVGPPGVFVIDTKRWMSHNARLLFDGKTLWYGSRPQTKALTATRQRAELVARVLELEDTDSAAYPEAIVAVHGHPVPGGIVESAGVMVLNTRRLRGHLTTRPPRFRASQVHAIARQIAERLPAGITG
ncbi:MAG: nuclease-related domain-containing protein [Carbonactinosporaceae bacterium]